MRSSVIVVSYRPDEWLEAALRSAAETADHVVLVDNGSEGAASSMIGRRVGTDVLRLESNLGFPAAVNRGIEHAEGDLLALLNDDAIADPQWLKRSAEVLTDPGVAAVAPKLLLAHPFAELRFPDQASTQEPDPRPLGRMLHEVFVGGVDVLAGLRGGVHRLEHGVLSGIEQRWRWTFGADAVYVPLTDDVSAPISVNGRQMLPSRIVELVNNAGSYLSREGHGGDHGWEAADDGQFEIARECFGACGAAMVFTRETWRRVGPLAASFFAYYEDMDWCWRARLGGQRIVYEPSAVVRHIRSATSGGQAEASVRLRGDRNRMHTLARNAPIRIVRRQLARTREPDLPPNLHSVAQRRVVRGLLERQRLRQRWKSNPSEVWDRWAGVDEHWHDPGAAGQRVGFPPRLEFGE